jgi:hypothetical protein
VAASAGLVNNMIDARYIQYGALSGLLLLCTIMLSTIDDEENSVFAQITPASEKFGSDKSSPNSSPSTDDSNDDGSIDSSGSNDDNDGPGTEEQDETTTATEEQDTNTEFELTNPLVEEIMNKVNEALSVLD